jgi:hypothetical protein
MNDISELMPGIDGTAGMFAGLGGKPPSKETRVKLPTLHPDQVKAYMIPGRFKAIRCGRRWGKTELGITIAGDDAIHGKYVGWFAPEFKFIAETWRSIDEYLAPVKLSGSKDGVFMTSTKGRIDFWSLENEHAGRSRKYHTVIIDEGAFTKNGMMLDVWRKAIRPTLLDYRGRAFVLSNTNGNDPANFLWQICNQPEHGFVQYHAPTHRNPYLPKEELDKLQAENHPLVYQQEYLAEFVDWSGEAFFSRDKMLVDGQPVEMPAHCDCVYAVVDTAVKTGKENDGTGVTYYARNRFVGHPLVVLDWELQQIEGSLLEAWLPNVYMNLEALAKRCGARAGSLGAFIEDKASGSILLQQAARRGWPATSIDSKLTAVGKDERAISVSGYVYQGLVKLCREAFEKTSQYKATTRNHLLGQVIGFRIGDKDASREDDLLDTFCYGVAIGLGDRDGF